MNRKLVFVEETLYFLRATTHISSEFEVNDLKYPTDRVPCLPVLNHALATTYTVPFSSSPNLTENTKHRIRYNVYHECKMPWTNNLSRAMPTHRKKRTNGHNHNYNLCSKYSCGHNIHKYPKYFVRNFFSIWEFFSHEYNVKSQ